MCIVDMMMNVMFVWWDLNDECNDERGRVNRHAFCRCARTWTPREVAALGLRRNFLMVML